MGWMTFDWQSLNIETRGRTSGDIKTLCPRCSHLRKHKRDRCLSVNLTEGIFNCHHCGWADKARTIGGFPTMKNKQRRKTVYNKPEFVPGAEPIDKTIEWFQKRGISEAVVRRNRIEAREHFMPDSLKTERCLAFPYIRNGEIVNVQYRTADKRFALEKGCELIFYGIDDIVAGEPIIIVEGQIDKLSLEEAGYKNCISVPNGWQVSADAPWLESAEPILEKAEYFILAGDNDDGGLQGQTELARRLGPERCRQAEWPEDCKDANDVLVKHGREAIIDAIECAPSLPINGITDVRDLQSTIERVYVTGIKSGVDVGWNALAELYKPMPREMTVITGAPGMGKSGFTDAMLINLANLHGWRFAVYSPEQFPLEDHVMTYLELWSGQPFTEGFHPRMSPATRDEGMQWLDDYFTFIGSDDELIPTVDVILEQARICIRRYGINALLIDPWNGLDHSRPNGEPETEYIGKQLMKIQRFCKVNDIHVFIVAHPVKLQKREDGSYPVASLYDISGSANWFNMPDMGLSVWRDKQDDYAPVQIHVQKVRKRRNGHLGVAELRYDRVSGRLFEWKNDR